MKKLVICILAVLFMLSCTDDTMSRKKIDSLVNSIERLENTQSITSIQSLDCWDTVKGHYLDSSEYVFTIAPNTRALLKVNYKMRSSNEHVVFYYNGDYLVAARLISDDDFPSWQNSFHYFQRKSTFNKHNLVAKEVGSESENDVREFLLFEGYSNIRYYKDSLIKKFKG